MEIEMRETAVAVGPRIFPENPGYWLFKERGPSREK